MPARAKSICRKHGCTVLLDKPGYCQAHIPTNHLSLRELDKNKTDEQRRFYSSGTWTRASKRHRQIEPLCRRCSANGKTVVGELVHHNPPLEELLAKGLSPYDDNHLETLCFSCHQKELRGKRK